MKPPYLFDKILQSSPEGSQRTDVSLGCHTCGCAPDEYNLNSGKTAHSMSAFKAQPTDGKTYAAVEAKTSTLRADVKIANVAEKSVVKITMIPRRVKVLLTK